MSKKYICCLAAALMMLAGALAYVNYTGLGGINCSMITRSISDYKIGLYKEHYKEGCEEAVLLFNGDNVPYDSLSEVYLISQDMEDVSWQGIISVDAGEVFYTRDEMWNDKAAAIKGGHAFELMIIDPDKEEYRTVRCVFTGLPVLSITMDDVNKGTFAGGEEVAWRGEFVLHDGSNKPTSSKASFKRRGASTYYDPKYGIRIELDDKFELLGMRKDDDWQLNALYDDLGLIHNDLAYSLWNQMAASNNVANDEAIAERYIELIFDDEYWGVYLLQERYDAKKVKAGEDDLIFKSFDAFEPEYLEDCSLAVDYKYGELSDEEAYKVFGQWMKDLDDVDYENFVDYAIFCNLTSAIDNRFKNIYFIGNKEKDGGYKFAVLPWDLNLTFGCYWKGDWENNENVAFNPKSAEGETMFWGAEGLEAKDGDKFNEAERKRWKELRKDVITEENLEGMASERLELLVDSGAYARNEARWPECAGKFDEKGLYKWIEERIEDLNEEY